MKIKINNAMCEVQDAPKELLSDLNELLSYGDKNVEYAYNNTEKQILRLKKFMKRETDSEILEGYRRRFRKLEFLLNSHEKNRRVYLMEGNNFPSGLLNKVLDFLDEKEVYWEIEDTRKVPNNKTRIKLKKDFPELRYFQKEALNAILEEERGIIVAPTGSGKSILFSKIIHELGLDTILITPNKSINDNAYDTLVSFFGPRYVEKLTKKGPKKLVSVVNIQTLVKIDPKLLEKQDVVIIDEFHHSAAETYRTVNIEHLKNCYYRIGLTATNFRNSGDDLALQAVLSDVVYRYSIKQAIQDKHLVPPTFKWINNKNSIEGTYQTQYKEGIVQNEERNQQIADICENHKDDNVLVLVQQIAHGEILLSYLPNATFLSGKEKDDDRIRIMEDFRNGKIKCLIGTGVIGEGVDLPIANVLIMAGGGKAKSQVIQNIGRVLRTYPGKEKALIYDFTDKKAKYLEAHAEERLNIYRENYE